MVWTTRIALALALAGLAVSRGEAQTTTGPGASGPAAPFLTQPFPWMTGPSCQTGGPPACAHYEDRNGPLLIGDPLLDGGTTNLGWTGSVELNVLKPNVHARLDAPVPLSTGGSDTVALPFAGQDWTVMPRFEVGYRFGQATGEVLLSYRFLLSSGTESTPTFDPLGPGTLSSRVNLHVWDLDWAGHENALGPNWDMKWRVGVRMTNIYTETRATGGFVTKRVESFFMGAGPHIGLDLRRKLGIPGLSLFGRIDNAYPIGPLTQTYEETRVTGAVGNLRLTSPGPITTLGVQLGLDYQLWDRLTVTAGYTQERFFDLVTFFGTNRSEQIELQGAFVRAQWKY